MRYEVAKLRKAIEEAKAYIKKRDEEQYSARMAEYEQAQTDWLAQYGELWAGAGKNIRAKALKGQMITREDLPRNKDRYGSSYPPLWDDRQNRPQRFQSTDLEVFRVADKALSLITDETVSATDLARLGVTAPNLRTLLQLASREGEE